MTIKKYNLLPALSLLALFLFATTGCKAATMPPFGNSLSEEQLQDIVAYTLSFAN